ADKIYLRVVGEGTTVLHFQRSPSRLSVGVVGGGHIRDTTSTPTAFLLFNDPWWGDHASIHVLILKLSSDRGWWREETTLPSLICMAASD
ncbi:hypothetical protein FRC03_006480, partial [Tulasnella sp. 419]